MIGNDACARESKLGSLVERSRSTLLLHRFLIEGKVATQASLQPCNDSEYIGKWRVIFIEWWTQIVKQTSNDDVALQAPC